MMKKKNVPDHIDYEYSFYSEKEKKMIFSSLQQVDNYFIKWQTNYKNLGIVVFILERANKVAVDALKVGETPQCPRIVSETWSGSMKVQRTRQLLFEGCRLI